MQNSFLTEINNFNKNAIEVISTTPLLSDEEKGQIIATSESMDKAFNNSQIFRTETEAIISVLNDIKHPTDASKYFQCLRELNVHQCELVGLLFEYEKKQQEIVIKQTEIDELKDDMEELILNNSKKYRIVKTQSQINIKEIEMKEHMFQLKNMRRTAIGRKQELLMWDKIIKQLEPSLVEKGISTTDVNDHQLVSYTMRFIKQGINLVRSAKGSSTAEVNNLMGQLITSISVIRAKNMENHLLTLLDPIERLFVAQNNMISETNKILILEHYRKELAITNESNSVSTDQG